MRTYLYTYTYIYTYTYPYPYPYIYIYIHTYINTYVHVHRQTDSQPASQTDRQPARQTDIRCMLQLCGDYSHYSHIYSGWNCMKLRNRLRFPFTELLPTPRLSGSMVTPCPYLARFRAMDPINTRRVETSETWTSRSYHASQRLFPLARPGRKWCEKCCGLTDLVKILQSYCGGFWITSRYFRFYRSD